MYALVKNNNIETIINNPKALVIDNVQYPAKIFELWSSSELNAIGIYEIISDTSNFKNEEYYINTDAEYNFENEQVTKSWGTATAKILNDENAVDEDNNPILDADGNQVVNFGLKTLKKNIVKQQASGLLTPTDWYVVKASEVVDYNVPENITNYRSEVRAKSNEMETQIDSCTTVEQLETLYTYTEQEDGTQTRPLVEFPKEVV